MGEKIRCELSRQKLARCVLSCLHQLPFDCSEVQTTSPPLGEKSPDVEVAIPDLQAQHLGTDSEPAAGNGKSLS